MLRAIRFSPFYEEDSDPGGGRSLLRGTPVGCNLEEEIRQLRRRMEEMFLEEKSFTSTPVIEISRLLDVKINEYMRRSKSSS